MDSSLESMLFETLEETLSGELKCNFKEALALGLASRDDFDFYVEYWHTSPVVTGPLHEWLGLTWEEYKEFI